jgi:predicted deacylase
MQIGTATGRRGELARGHLVLGSYPDGVIQSPVIIATGPKPGPTLWVQGCIHGPEVVGPMAILRFLKELRIEELAGTVACLMIANPLGFRGYNRLTPHDGYNLNRVFPGDPQGHFTQQLAHTLLETSTRHGDVLLDLHSGGDLTITAHYTLFHNDGSAAGRESERLARACGAPNVWNSLEESLSGCHFVHFTRRGKPALIVESGGGARVTPEDHDRSTAAIFNVCRALGMLPGEPARPSRYRLGGDAVYVKATEGGLFQPLVAPGDDVVAGQPLGRIMNLFGDVAQEIVCPVERAWIGSVRRPNMPIYNGDQAFEIVATKGWDPA